LTTTPAAAPDDADAPVVLDVAGWDGLRLTADAFGSPDDPPAVLFHGGGQTRHAWGTTPRVLAAGGWYVLRVDMRGHGESDWPDDADYRLDAFANDVVAITHALPTIPVLVGASMGGLASLLAIGESPDPVARALVLVDVAPTIEQAGAERIGDFMSEHMETGFGSLEEVADAIAAYNPHRPRPKDLSGLRKNLRLRDDGRWAWHWDPRFIGGVRGARDETRATVLQPERLQAAARHVTIPTLLVRGKMSDLLSEAGAQELLELVPHAEYVNVAGAGHMVAGDRNDLFNDAIVGFLDRLR
jgi:pimeloyl-ACP methyl ester carboxylesterase